MFLSPSTSIPKPVTDAAKFLNDANSFITQCRQFQREQFQSFWFNAGVPKSVEEINSILEAMDSASPGQSVRFFQSAKELVELILAIAPDGLGEADWLPPYSYAVDPATMQLRCTEVVS